MKRIIELYIELSNKYYSTNDKKLKIDIAYSLEKLQIFIDKYGISNVKNKKLLEEYNVLHKFNSINCLMSSNVKKFIEIFGELQSSYSDFLLYDLEYLKEIMKYVIPNYKLDNNIKHDFKYTYKDYIKNSHFEDYINSDKYEIIVDNIFDETCSFNINNKSILLFDEKFYSNSNYLLHELIHSYIHKINFKYTETPSILGEMGLYYNKLNKFPEDRLYDINYLKTDLNNNYFDITYYRKYIVYYIACIISVPFIYTHGSEFKNILKAIDLIKENDKLSIQDIYKLLNINENDIVKSLNKSLKL